MKYSEMVDDKGRRHVRGMSERELLEEMTENSRKVADLAEQFFTDLRTGKINPMSLIMGMFGK